MKKIREKILILLSILCFALTAEAHSPDVSSTILSEQEDGKWVLQVRAALTAYEYEIHQHYGSTAYKTPEEFRQLVIQHIQKNLSVQFDQENTITLSNGVVKLGHETNAVFEVIGVPKKFSSVEFKNSTFQDISRNQSALIIFKKGLEQKQFILNDANQHTAQLQVKDGQLLSLNQPEGTMVRAMPNRYFVIGLFSMFILFTYIRYRRSMSL